MRRVILPVILFVALASAPAEAGALGLCQRLLTRASGVVESVAFPLRNAWAWVRAPRSARQFDLAKFKLARERYAQLLEAPAPATGPAAAAKLDAPSSLEEQLGLIDAAVARTPSPLGLEAPLEQQRYVARTRLARLLKRYDFREGLTLGQLQELSAELYLIAEGSPYSLSRWVTNGTDATMRKIFYRVFQERFAAEGLEKAVSRAGWLRNPKLRESLRALLAGKRVRLAVQLVLDLGLLTKGYPPYLPREEWVKWIDVPDSLTDKVLKEGFDAAWPELAARYSGRIKADLVYNRTRRVVMAGIGAVIAYVMYEQLKEMERELREEIRDDEDDDGELDASLIRTTRAAMAEALAQAESN